MTLPALRTIDWSSRWSGMARALGLSATEPMLVALSGGADSVFLLHVVARAEPRPRVLAVYVDHGLRGEEAREDAAFCARLCAKLGTPFARRALDLKTDDDVSGPGSNLEARAREGRYRILAEEALGAGMATILTGHHEDDALETLLLRWMRGSALPGLPGLKLRNRLAGRAAEGVPAIDVVRPLLSMRREEVRRILRDEGLAWREDSSNASPCFSRNRVRNGLLPRIEATCGAAGVTNLRAFARAVETFEEELASRTAHLAWQPPVHAPALRASGAARVGGTLSRAQLAPLARPLMRRALWRLIAEGTGGPPSRALLTLVVEDIARGRTARHTLPGGWRLQLRADLLHLLPPSRDLPRLLTLAPHAMATCRQLPFPFAPDLRPAPPGPVNGPLRLSLPGLARLADGRSIVAEVVHVPSSAPPPRAHIEVELEASDLPHALTVRTARPGDRFHALGAPGSRPLRRFLADAGIPREERARVPLVFAGDELIWVAGVRPCQSRRIRRSSEHRLRLKLEGAAAAPGAVPDEAHALFDGVPADPSAPRPEPG